MTEDSRREWLERAVAHLMGAEAYQSSSRGHRRKMRELLGMGLQVPDQLHCVDFLARAKRPFSPGTCTLKDLQLMADVQKNGGLGTETGSSHISHREPVVRSPIVAMIRGRGRV